MGVTSGAGNTFPSGAPEFTPIVYSVLRFMASDYPFGIFKLFFNQLNNHSLWFHTQYINWTKISLQNIL
jgi:hypothetical protein